MVSLRVKSSFVALYSVSSSVLGFEYSSVFGILTPHQPMVTKPSTSGHYRAHRHHSPDVLDPTRPLAVGTL